MVYAVLRDTTGLVGFCLQKCFTKCLRCDPRNYWREPHLQKCGGVIFDKGVLKMPFIYGVMLEEYGRLCRKKDQRIAKKNAKKEREGQYAVNVIR